QAALTQYRDYLSGDLLFWEMEPRGGNAVREAPPLAIYLLWGIRPANDIPAGNPSGPPGHHPFIEDKSSGNQTSCSVAVCRLGSSRRHPHRLQLGRRRQEAIQGEGVCREARRRADRQVLRSSP